MEIGSLVELNEAFIRQNFKRSLDQCKEFASSWEATPAKMNTVTPTQNGPLWKFKKNDAIPTQPVASQPNPVRATIQPFSIGASSSGRQENVQQAVVDIKPQAGYQRAATPPRRPITPDTPPPTRSRVPEFHSALRSAVPDAPPPEHVIGWGQRNERLTETPPQSRREYSPDRRPLERTPPNYSRSLQPPAIPPNYKNPLVPPPVIPSSMYYSSPGGYDSNYEPRRAPYMELPETPPSRPSASIMPSLDPPPSYPSYHNSVEPVLPNRTAPIESSTSPDKPGYKKNPRHHLANQQAEMHRKGHREVLEKYKNKINKNRPPSVSAYDMQHILFTSRLVIFYIQGMPKQTNTVQSISTIGSSYNQRDEDEYRNVQNMYY